LHPTLKNVAKFARRNPVAVDLATGFLFHGQKKTNSEEVIRMYVPDTLRRIDNRKVLEYQKKLKSTEGAQCDYCGRPATQIIEVFNPADGLRGIEGAYAIEPICDECHKDEVYLEERFYCPGCKKLFITHHSWDYLAVKIDGELYCQGCALPMIRPVELGLLLCELLNGIVHRWHRLNNGGLDTEEIWSGEFSDYPDFPGHTSLRSVALEIFCAARERGLAMEDRVIPLVTQTYQFSVVLGVYR
jgi:hypothetical protein